MLRYLRTSLSMGADTLESELLPLRLAPFLEQWQKANPAIVREDAVSLSPDDRVLVDERHLAMALEGACWQLARMGSRQGDVALGVRVRGDRYIHLGLWRPDGALDGDVLVRAVASRDEDWSVFLRRLPACGFPLRIALRLVASLGGEAHVDREAQMLILTIPVRVSAA